MRPEMKWLFFFHGDDEMLCFFFFFGGEKESEEMASQSKLRSTDLSMESTNRFSVKEA